MICPNEAALRVGRAARAQPFDRGGRRFLRGPSRGGASTSRSAGSADASAPASSMPEPLEQRAPRSTPIGRTSRPSARSSVIAAFAPPASRLARRIQSTASG